MPPPPERKTTKSSRTIKNSSETSEKISAESKEDSKEQLLLQSSNTPSSRSCFLPYQFRGDFNLGSDSLHEGLPSRKDLSRCHKTLRLGLGTPVNNLKTAHVINSKVDQEIPLPMKKCVPGYRRTKTKDSSLTAKMQKLSIYESPPKIENCAGRGAEDGNVKKKSKQPSEKVSVFDKAFKALDKKANSLALGEKVTFNLDNGQVIVAKKEQKEELETKKLSKSKSSSKVTAVVAPTKDLEAEAIPNLCRTFRNLFGWKLSLHNRWKNLEDRVKLWPNKVNPPTLQDVAAILKISVDELRLLQISPDLKETYRVLKKNLCSVNLPNISKVLALAELQKENINAAARYASECPGMFLESEIVDKHLTYIRRQEEMVADSPRSENEKLKTSLFLKQVKDTLDFSESFFDSKGDSEFVNAISSFNPDWNIIQIVTSVHTMNRFSNEIIGKRQVPQLILSAFCNIPGEKKRCHFTSFCKEPVLEPGSSLRFGLIEEFQKVLDKNLAISDEMMVISRKKYWEERAKHNEILETVMFAMEEWVNPWTFLFPGRIMSKDIQQQIHKKVLSMLTELKLRDVTDSQKLLVCRLTENYNIVPAATKIVLDSLLAYILKIDEDTAHLVARAVADVGSLIRCDEPRYPTILILDQEIDILPWDWLSCFRNTDVTRMPSLNMINTSKNISKVMKKDSPAVVNPESCTFILNPDGTLPNVQQRMEHYLTSRTTWTPIVARPPTSQEMQDTLENKDLLLYCGHGAGSAYYPEYAVQKLACKAVPLLMGCSSAQSHYNGPRLCAYSVVNTYFIAGCASVVGFLWEVTDMECDRLTVDLLERWLPYPSVLPPKMPFFDRDSTERTKEPSLPTALRKSRKAATQFLTQCAAVCYGLPISTIN